LPTNRGRFVLGYAEVVRGFRGKKMPTTVCCSLKRAAKEKPRIGGALIILVEKGRLISHVPFNCSDRAEVGAFQGDRGTFASRLNT
jgi:hypothetical protein